MRLINTNLLNYFYKNGLKPVKDAIANKLDKSRGANNLYTTEEGFYLDARQGPVIKGELDKVSSNLSELSSVLNKQSVVLTAAQINAAAGGSYFSSGNVSIVYSKKYAQVDFALYLNTQFGANTSYNFAIPIKTQYAQRWAVTGGGKHFIIAVSAGTFTVLPAENLTAGDNFRDSFFVLRTGV